MGLLNTTKNTSKTPGLNTYLLLTITIMMINLFSWNCRGIMSSAFALSEFLDTYDIDVALVTEHKLFPKSANFLESINPKYCSYATFDESVDQYGSLRCGKAGTAVLYKKSLKGTISQLPLHNDRISGIEIICENDVPLYIFCVYLPACQNVNLYKTVLCDLESIMTHYSQIGCVIAAGDYNGQYLHGSKSGNVKSQLLTRLIDSNNLISLQYAMNKPDKYTYVTTETSIDHVITGYSFSRNVRTFDIIDTADVLTSDHLPILVSFEAQCRYANAPPPRQTLAWNKCTDEHITLYQTVLEQELNCILNTNCDKCQPDLLNAIIVNAIKNASCCIPRSTFNARAKPYWCPALKEAHSRARQFRRAWVCDNQPRTEESRTYVQYKQAKTAFRRLQRQMMLQNENTANDELTKCAELDYRQFWKLLKRRSGNKAESCNEIILDNTHYRDENIANGFRSFFQNVFSNEHVTKDTDRDVINGASNFAKTECTDPLLTATVCPREVKTAINTLKKCKAPGIDNIHNEHILFGGEVIIRSLTTLFNSILFHERLPDTWRTSILIPIFKGKGKTKTDPNSYRPVSLLPCFCKLLEKVILSRLNTHVVTNNMTFPSAQQQGFQKGLSCITTCFTLQETIFHQIESGSNAHVAFLDQKAAFDSVWHTGLFYKLGRLGFTGQILRLIADMYTDLKCVVRVNAVTSEPLNVTRSVRQGGVLSTFLYLTYVDQLLVELEASNNGCTVQSLKGGNPSFADDISLVANSPLRLQRLVDTVYRYCRKWKIDMNVDKSNTVVFTKRRHAPPIWIMYGDKYIKQTDHVTHLGIRHDFNLKHTLRINERLQKARNGFFAIALQGVNPDGVNPLVSIDLYKKVIKPIALYGSELWFNLSPSCLRSINRFQHFVVKKVQGLPSSTRSDMCEAMIGLHKLNCDISVKKLLFLHKILSLDTKSVCRNVFLRRYYSFVTPNTSVTYGYIPDICSLLYKYGLQSFISDVIHLPACLPSKRAWTILVKRLVYTADEESWRSRVTTDDDFVLFRELCPTVHTCIIYNVCRFSSTRAILKTVTRAWSERYRLHETDILCDLCCCLYRNKLEHLLHECDATSHLRTTFYLDNLAYGSDFTDQLRSLDSVNLTLRLLGAPTHPKLDCDSDMFFLLRSFKYIHECCMVCRMY